MLKGSACTLKMFIRFIRYNFCLRQNVLHIVRQLLALCEHRIRLLSCEAIRCYDMCRRVFKHFSKSHEIFYAVRDTRS